MVNDYLIQGENIVHVIRNLREAQKELKRGYPISCNLHIEYSLGVLLQRKETQQHLSNVEVKK